MDHLGHHAVECCPKGFLLRQSTLANSLSPGQALQQASYGSGRACGPKGSILAQFIALHLFQMPQFLDSLRLAQVSCQFERTH
jgi:hypothetical protein